MLIATPYRDFDVRDKSPPRIISEIKKSCTGSRRALTSFRPKLTGDLLLKFGNERNWWPRRVSIRCGQLLVFTAHGVEGPTSLRIPLRHLSIQAGPLPNSFALSRGQSILLTLQASSGRVFDEWVKIIAIELIRQTPLDAIKYLDILTFQECWTRRDPQNCDKDWNFNNCNPDAVFLESDHCDTCQRNKEEDTKTPVHTQDRALETIQEQKNIEDLLKKCQNPETYVSVKDKLCLFESLCKMGRKVRSTESIPVKVHTDNKRAQSLHDLSRIGSHIAVREICKLFENKIDQGVEQCTNVKTIKLSDAHMNRMNKFVGTCNT